MTPREVVRRALVSSLGLSVAALEGCSADGRTSAGGVVEVVPSATESVATPHGSSRPRTPIKPTGVGYVQEKSGLWHRAGPATCDTTIDEPSCKGTEGHRECSKDADCVAAPHGKCTSWVGQIGDGCSCSYACETDADCAKMSSTEDWVCVCKDAARVTQSRCAFAKCASDDACASAQCAVSRYDDGCGTSVQLACKTVNDDCQSEKDCGPYQSCAVGDNGVWSCMSAGCAIGRPLTVGDRSARASERARSDWASRTGSRDAEAAFWLEMAALEHASIASFARFSMQLLALGAPAYLVGDTQRAAMDEIEHARLAYGLASSALGRAVGPGDLPEARLPISFDVAQVTRALVLEGCAGETIGAIEALEASMRASDAEVARVLRRVGEDELRHAELAFRCLSWFVRAFGDVAREAARAAIVEVRLSGSERELEEIVGPIVRSVVAA